MLSSSRKNNVTMYIWNLGTPFLFWIMGGGTSIWDCELCVSMGGVLGDLERERERESLMTSCLFLEENLTT